MTLFGITVCRPGSIPLGCFGNGTHGAWHAPECDFGAVAGMMWDMRSRQYLLANGIAVLQVNPGGEESWDWYAIPSPYHRHTIAKWRQQS